MPGQRRAAHHRPQGAAVRRAGARRRAEGGPHAHAEGRSPASLQGAGRLARGGGPDNGQILAMASNPPFDNRFFVGGISQPEVRRSSSATLRQPAGEPGHPGQLPDRLDDEDVHVGRRAELPHPPVRQLHDRRQRASTSSPAAADEPSGCEKHNAGGALYGKINLPEALTVSSDVYFYGLGNDMWTEEPEGPVHPPGRGPPLRLRRRSRASTCPFENAGVAARRRR